MADKKLNEVTKVTDMAYVPVIMADGSIGQIAKADLASVVAGEIQYRRYRYVSGNNKYSLEVDLNGLGWDNGLAKKWELYGGQWNQKPICYASGICRLYGSGFDNVLITSKSSIEPTASITSEGYLHVEFGIQLSYARLYVYYDLQ